MNLSKFIGLLSLFSLLFLLSCASGDNNDVVMVGSLIKPPVEKYLNSLGYKVVGNGMGMIVAAINTGQHVAACLISDVYVDRIDYEYRREARIFKLASVRLVVFTKKGSRFEEDVKKGDIAALIEKGAKFSVPAYPQTLVGVMLHKAGIYDRLKKKALSFESKATLAVLKVEEELVDIAFGMEHYVAKQKDLVWCNLNVRMPLVWVCWDDKLANKKKVDKLRELLIKYGLKKL